MNILIFLFFYKVITATFIPNINILSVKEFNNYQNILETKKIPCFMQNVRIKSFRTEDF